MADKIIFVISIHEDNKSYSNFRVTDLGLAKLADLKSQIEVHENQQIYQAHYTRPIIRCASAQGDRGCRICHCAICDATDFNKFDMQRSKIKHYTPTKIGRWPEGIVK